METVVAPVVVQLSVDCEVDFSDQVLASYIMDVNLTRTAGNTANMRVAQAELASLFYRLGRHEPAATIAGFAFSPLTAALPEFSATIAGLRDLLGDPTYELLARKGETMTTAAMATYAYDQIDQARTELEHSG